MQFGSRDALLVIDVQNDFCPGGALAVPGGHEVVPVCNALMASAHHVLLTQDWHPAGHISFASSHRPAAPFTTLELPYGTQTLWPEHCIQRTHGASFHPDLVRTSSQQVIRKGHRPAIDSYSAFFENDRTTPTGLEHQLRAQGIERLFLCGLATDYCVLYSALDACRTHFDTFVVEDAVRGIDLEGSVTRAWQQMAQVGVQRIQSAALLAR